MTRLTAATGLAVLLMQLASCAGGTVGVSTSYPDPYWGSPIYGYDLGYFYGPPVVYGGWGPGYFVGPPRWGARPPIWNAPPRPGRPGFRPPPPGRPMPSIPSAPRGGGMRGGPR
jgi:hypothetical protein